MPDSFVVLWTKERCGWLKRVGDSGPLLVVFGSPHTSMPSINQVHPGDSIYPVLVANGALYVIAGMKVSSIVPADDFVRQHLGIERPPLVMWDQLFRTLKRTQPSIGHRVPFTCADAAAVAEVGSEIRFDRQLPVHKLTTLRLGPTPGKEQPLKGLIGDHLKNNLSLHGHVRRLSLESGADFAELLVNGPYAAVSAV